MRTKDAACEGTEEQEDDENDVKEKLRIKQKRTKGRNMSAKKITSELSSLQTGVLYALVGGSGVLR